MDSPTPAPAPAPVDHLTAQPARVYRIEGMTGVKCCRIVETAARSVRGVANASVSLDDRQLTVGGRFSERDLLLAIEDAGYKAEP